MTNGTISPDEDGIVVVYRAAGARDVVELQELLRGHGLSPQTLHVRGDSPGLRYSSAIPIGVPCEEAERARVVLHDWEHAHDVAAERHAHTARRQLARLMLVVGAVMGLFWLLADNYVAKVVLLILLAAAIVATAVVRTMQTGRRDQE